VTVSRRWSAQDAYAADIDAAAASAGIPLDVAYGLIAHESGFNANAIGDNGRSYGLVQIQLATARGLGYTGDGPGLLVPAVNVSLGFRYLRGQLDRAGTIAAALSAYNGGYRPSLGYGAPRADGTFANQAYVSAVLGKAAYFQQYLTERDGTPPGTIAEAGAGGLLGWILSLGLVGALLARLRKRKG